MEMVIKGVKPCRKLKWLTVMTDYEPDPTLLLPGRNLDSFRRTLRRGRVSEITLGGHCWEWFAGLGWFSSPSLAQLTDEGPEGA